MKENIDLIVFYDGECGLCNTSVQFVINHEKSSEIHFSALQSDFAKQFFKNKQFATPDLTTFYFYKEGRLFSKSTAALQLTKFLRFPYSGLQFFVIVPVFIRDLVYSFVSKRRLKFVSSFCVIPTVENQKRFLKDIF
jgi:predicted DCC family thiol-disulfide oxidoreductase YuxK